jgi:uncharacterized protein (TIGR03083 family)
MAAAMNETVVHARTAANRRLAADFFDSLTEEQLGAQSLCAAWTVREVLAHLAMPLSVGLGHLVVRIVRARGSVDRASEAVAVELAELPVRDLTALLREHAGKRVRAPGVGPMGQMADGCIHLRDCARPLGMPHDVTLDDWRMVLDWLPTRQASLGVVPRGRLDGLTLRATDQEWSWGSGAEVTGPSEAIAMAVSGRQVALEDLTGPGLQVLRSRVRISLR